LNKFDCLRQCPGGWAVRARTARERWPCSPLMTGHNPRAHARSHSAWDSRVGIPAPSCCAARAQCTIVALVVPLPPCRWAPSGANIVPLDRRAALRICVMQASARRGSTWKSASRKLHWKQGRCLSRTWPPRTGSTPSSSTCCCSSAQKSSVGAMPKLPDSVSGPRDCCTLGIELTDATSGKLIARPGSVDWHVDCFISGQIS
jgi:hypothetical protein